MLHTEPAVHATPPAVIVAFVLFSNVSVGLMNVSAIEVKLAGTTLVVDREIVSVCKRVISTVSGPVSSEMLPGSSSALDNVTSNDNGDTPAGGVSVIKNPTGVPGVELPVPKPAPWPPPPQPVTVALSARKSAP
jgi:hypothetical protein